MLSTFKVMNANEKMTFDAIVIGSGITGAGAAKEFCDKGLKALVIERGQSVNIWKIILQMPLIHGT